MSKFNSTAKGFTQKSYGDENRQRIAVQVNSPKLSAKDANAFALHPTSTLRRCSRRDSSGFSLLEVVVALGIIAVGVVGVLALLAQSARAGRGADNSLIAAQLAQEGIELVVNVRDTNWVQNNPNWKTGLQDTTAGIISYDGTAVIRNVSQARQCLGLDNSGYYRHDAGNCGLFSRRVELRSLTDDLGVSYLEVRAVVFWQDRGGTRSITVVDHLYDWR